MQKESKGKVIIGVLNWGLGHATRCEMVIRRLIEHGFEPVIASDGQALSYLQALFPDLPCEELPAYKIAYGRKNLLGKIALQLPRIARAQRHEYRALKSLVEKHRPVGVVSDNRLGFWHKDVPSVYLTHQLKLMLPFGRKRASLMHHYFINKYDECWVPDRGSAPNLSGEISHDLKPRIPVKYIGPLSRFAKMDLPSRTDDFDYAIVLSGPEPQRSLLEEQLLEGLKAGNYRIALIRGTGKKPVHQYPADWAVIDLADSKTVADIIRSSKMVISRSGYSSVMDYVYLGNKALLIPTPGQPEQVYLARYLTHTGRFLYAEQNYLQLEKNLLEAEAYRGLADFPKPDTDWGALFSLFEGKAES